MPVKMVTVRVSERETYKMTEADAERFWRERERQARAKQAAAMAAVTARRADAADWGVAMRCEDASARSLLSAMGLDVQAEEQTGLGHERTLYLDPAAPLKMELVPAGFKFLDRFEICAPVWSYDDLANAIGNEADRERTAALIHDLRVPVYDVRVLFIRRCDATDDLVARWQEEKADGGDERLAFQRALYRVKPLILPLPVTWIHGK